MAENKPAKAKPKKVSQDNKKYVAVVGLHIEGSVFEPGEIITKKIPQWMIDQKKVIEDK